MNYSDDELAFFFSLFSFAKKNIKRKKRAMGFECYIFTWMLQSEFMNSIYKNIQDNYLQIVWLFIFWVVKS